MSAKASEESSTEGTLAHKQEIITSSEVVRAAAELSVNYEANAAHYLTNVKAMREPKASNM